MLKYQRFSTIAFGLAILGLGLCGVQAVIPTPLQSDPFSAVINWQSLRGVPVSTKVELGSDGRGPTQEAQIEAGLTTEPAANQFSTFVTFSSVAAPTSSTLTPGAVNLSASAVSLGLPVGKKNNAIVAVLVRAQVGAPYILKAVGYKFGQVIAPPSVDIDGKNFAAGVTADEYWRAEPFSTNGHATARYYWSPHARQVFATQPGPLEITWSVALPRSVVPSSGLYQKVGNYYYRLTNQLSLVSGTAYKAPVTIFWNQKSFARSSAQVIVPNGTLVGMNIITNTSFLSRVAKGYLLPGEVSPVEEENEQFLEKRTLWYDSSVGSINAYNIEGRAFLEYYGSRRADGITHEFLGYEIVDVRQRADIVRTEVFLGDPLTPAPSDLAGLDVTPQPVQTPKFMQQVYYLAEAENDPVLNKYWAVEEVSKEGEVLVYWMQRGVLGVRWPVVLDNYIQKWPTDPGMYSHYIRPRADTDVQASASGISLPSLSVPKLMYQDPLDRPRAFLDTSSIFYTWLTPEVPSTRALLQYKLGPSVYFERVFSWLNTSSDAGATAFTNSVATQLQDPSRPAIGLGGGLLASYWNDLVEPSTREPDYTAIAPVINFDWNNNPVSPSINKDYFTASFTGMVQALSTEVYTFYGIADDYVRVWVNDQKVVDGWNKGINVSYSGTISLEANKLYSIRVEYLEIIGAATMSLSWSTPTIAKAIIPQSQLYAPTAKRYAQVLPRIVREQVDVGQRIQPPFGEQGSGQGANYLAGHLNTATGTSFAIDAYIDPITMGFDAANLGAIIPINAIPGKNILEVWWFRQNSPPTGKGFTPVMWPSVIGYYTVNWPSVSTDKIILASNNGSKPLTSLPAKGWLYYQNDRNEMGFNPNEEHALLQGGSAWALRDDLNIITVTNYTSKPYTLLEYVDADARPSMKVFQILRDDVTNGISFNYTYEVGTKGLAALMQGPMPLGLLEAPRNPVTQRSMNSEVSGINIVGTTLAPVTLNYGRSSLQFSQVTMNLGERTSVPTHREYVLVGNLPGNQFVNYWVYLTSADPGENSANTYSFTGIVSPNRPAAVSSVGCPQRDGTIETNNGIYRYFVATTNSFVVAQNIQLWDSRAKIATPARVVATGSTNIVNIRTGVTESLNFVTVDFKNNLTAVNQTTGVVNADKLVWAVSNPTTFAFNNQVTGWTLRNGSTRVTPNRGWVSKGSQKSARDVQNNIDFNVNDTLFQDRNGSTWFYRGPHDGDDTATTTLRFYYKTLPGFYFPVNNSGTLLTLANQPEVGIITPYLRPWSDKLSRYVGDPIYGNTQSTIKGDDNAFGISYQTKWADDVPTLAMGQSLTDAVRGLPAVRGNISTRILYQQGQASGNAANIAVTLHDPTRQKKFALADTLSTTVLSKIPNSVSVQDYFGKYYFPALPPHLVGRFFFDSTVGKYGSLIFQGEFVKAITGDSYLLPNIISSSDLAYLDSVCDTADSELGRWKDALRSLSVTMTPFSKQAGQWLINPGSVMTTSYAYNELCQAVDQDTPVDSYALTAVGPGSGFVTLAFQDSLSPAAARGVISVQVIKVTTNLYQGEIKIVNASNPLSPYITLQQVVDLAGKPENYVFDWRMAAPVDGSPVPVKNKEPQSVNSDKSPGDQWLLVDSTKYPDKVRVTLGGTADVQALSDNYLIVRYRTTDTKNPAFGTWSAWTEPQLAEGWIKRVLAGVNPFSQRVSDLINNPVSDQVSMLSQAGTRWEGNVPLNQDSLNNFGLIPIYESVLNMGRNMSIESGINYGPANDALLLAAGYIADLYTILGNEAWVEANNPTVSVGDNANLSSIATSLFPFLGETASLMEQQQALLRGRDDFLTPGTRRSPVYNRLYWNYTRGINAGEIIYALHFNIKAAPNNNTGNVGASDAAYMFPQGHGDAYGHYLTALFNYYKLLMNPSFSWVPKSEAVTILDTPVAVNYFHERKFAATAATLARTGQLVYDLAWRESYIPGASNGWAFLQPSVQNINVQAGSQTNFTKRFWGADHWAARVGQGTYLNWVVGNSLLPDVDPDPLHFGIQKVDRQTVAELTELPTLSETLQNGMDNAEAHLNPLGLPENTVTFDLNPNLLTGIEPKTHFEQVYERATKALANAAYAFGQAQDVTEALRGQQDKVSELVSSIKIQEQSFTNQLIEIFGTPYSDDVGPGATYPQGYAGPDVVHFAYIDQTDLENTGGVLGFADPITGEDATPHTTGQMQVPFFNQEIYSWLTDPYLVDYTLLDRNSSSRLYDLANYYHPPDSPNVEENDYLYITVDTQGYISKPNEWTGKRTYSGTIQQAILNYKAVWWEYVVACNGSVGTVQEFNQRVARYRYIRKYLLEKETKLERIDKLNRVFTQIDTVNKIFSENADAAESIIDGIGGAMEEAVPDMMIFGLANGGDLTSPIASIVTASKFSSKIAVSVVAMAVSIGTISAMNDLTLKIADIENEIRDLDLDRELADQIEEMIVTTAEFTDRVVDVNLAARRLNEAEVAVQTAVQQGYQLLATRHSFRVREAAIIHGFRTRDASYRLFQNEKLERYNTLFNLAQRYSMLAAAAYDYETGLLGTTAGKGVITQIVGSRSLGVVDSSGNPQFVGEGAGDAGLSSVLAALWADWGVLKGRLGFNNPDGYGTVASLRSENFRILPDTSGQSSWEDLLNRSKMANLLADPDVRVNCLGLDKGDSLPVPGIVIPFSTTIANGYNLFGKSLAPGDHNFSDSSFATKIFSVGVALDGYLGMDVPAGNVGGVIASGGQTPTDPSATFTDPNALSATPYVYLIPVGVDSMRSPPLGDVSTIRSWEVADLAIPMPFNIGASGFSTKALWQSSDSLQEALFAVRKHQAFRPVPSASYFGNAIYGGNNGLQRSQFTNSRLIGRSVWNSQWKLVIPGSALLSNPEEGMKRLIQSVRDVKVYFVTYSYSGN